MANQPLNTNPMHPKAFLDAMAENNVTVALMVCGGEPAGVSYGWRRERNPERSQELLDAWSDTGKGDTALAPILMERGQVMAIPPLDGLIQEIKPRRASIATSTAGYSTNVASGQ